MSEKHYWLVARDKPGLLVALMRELAGDAHISFEGDLSRCRLDAIAGASSDESQILRRMSTYPGQDFVLLPLEEHSIGPILTEVLPEGRIVRDIIHVQIEKGGHLAFAAYDSFHKDCVVAWPVIPESLLGKLQKTGILRSFELATETGN